MNKIDQKNMDNLKQMYFSESNAFMEKCVEEIVVLRKNKQELDSLLSKTIEQNNYLLDFVENVSKNMNNQNQKKAIQEKFDFEKKEKKRLEILLKERNVEIVSLLEKEKEYQKMKKEWKSKEDYYFYVEKESKKMRFVVKTLLALIFIFYIIFIFAKVQ